MAEQRIFDERETEEYLVHSHNERVESLGDWKDRIEAARNLVKGELSYVNPDGVVVSQDLAITNLADQQPRDVARLVSEVEPSYRAPIRGNTDEDDLDAEVDGAIARGYFETNRFDVIRPYLSMDVDIAGGCFVCVWVDPSLDVPRFERIDPLFAYPDTYNGKLLDLLVIQQMKLRSAALIFPYEDFGGIFDGMAPNDDVTIMDYYGPKYNAKAIGRTGTDGSRMDPGKVHILQKADHGIDRVTVGFAMLPSPTGEFHGSLDQIGKPMATKNRLVSLITEYAHEGIYSPWEERGILNWNEDPGPDTRYHHNPSLDGETFIRRVAPAQFNGELFGLLQFLEGEQRAQLGFPASRSGEISQSQGSASFVAATQGQQTSIVRERQRLLSLLQEDIAEIAAQYEQKHEDYHYDKPLPYVVGDKKTYNPATDIKDGFSIRVEYGAGAGLDRINADQRLINFNTLGVLSGETVLEQTDFISDARGELQRRENEEITRILLEKWLSTPEVTPEIIGLTLTVKKNKGISLAEAWAEVQSKLAEQMAQAQQEEAAAQEAELGAQAAPAGAPAAAPGEQPSPEFAKTPIHQVITG